MYWKNEWILPQSQQKWMEVSVTIRKNSVDDAISYEREVGQKIMWWIPTSEKAVGVFPQCERAVVKSST